MLVKASQVTVLLRCLDQRGIIRIPIDGNGESYFGLNKFLDPSQAISKQLVAHAAQRIGRPDLAPQIEVLSTVEPVLVKEGQTPSLLYLMRIDPQYFQADTAWPTLIEALRGMPPGKMRVAYNKALQYFAGAADAKIDILEVDAEVQKRLSELRSQNPSTLIE